MSLENNIDIQLNKILKGNPSINVVKPCRINDGINQINSQSTSKYIAYFESIKNNKKITFFIPASGSGSRMFGKLYDFIQNKNNSDTATIEFIEQLLNNIKNFSFYNKLPQTFKDNLKIGQIDIEELINYILFKDGLNFSDLPKGLIPFHLYGNFIINPFQEHILQGSKIAGEKANFHFTINAKYEKDINHSIQILKEITGVNFSSSYSNQDINTNSTAFTRMNNVAIENEKPINRPSGHGALIHNLNNIDSDLIFIKNIDNIQHYNKATTALSTKKALGGILLSFQDDVFNLLNSINDSNWQNLAEELNTNYNLSIAPSKLKDKDWLFNYFNRPIRVCGMVKNEGQAGGGPFWTKDENGNLSKQIIEKAQFSSSQLSVMLHATHFNPVDIVCSVTTYKNTKFNLLDFVNSDLYFIVNKTQNGQNIKYIENPGLWNGSMYNWLTLFYEIHSDCFSPVKTVLDLLKPLHQEN
jgi:hypothetical protein